MTENASSKTKVSQPSASSQQVERENFAFSGTKRLYTNDGLEKLSAAKVCVVGMGGVGSWAVEALARTGIGHIQLIDLDDICVTNTNRQIHAHQGNYGRLKAEAMAERVLAINPQCQVSVDVDFINLNNQELLLSETPSFVIDAIDSVAAKVALIAYCKRHKIKIITIGGAGGQKDPLKITTADLSRTWQDPLAAKVRSELRRCYNFTKNPKRRFGIECVYSTEQLNYPTVDGKTSYEKSSINQDAGKLDCDTSLGTSVMVTATFGMIAAARVVEKLTKAV